MRLADKIDLKTCFVCLHIKCSHKVLQDNKLGKTAYWNILTGKDSWQVSESWLGKRSIFKRPFTSEDAEVHLFLKSLCGPSVEKFNLKDSDATCMHLRQTATKWKSVVWSDKSTFQVVLGNQRHDKENNRLNDYHQHHEQRAHLGWHCEEV